MPPEPNSSRILYLAEPRMRSLVLGGAEHGRGSPGSQGILDSPMRYLGLDLGDKLIGVALSDETATVAAGLETIRRTGPRKDVRAVAELVRRHGVCEVVVGLPRR